MICVVDGAAYTVGSRVTGVCIIMTLFTGLKNGVDVSSFLQSWGFEGNPLILVKPPVYAPHE